MHCVRNMLSIAVGLSLCVWPAGIGFAETVSVTKDCPAGGTCNVTGTTTPIGRFRTTTTSFNWEATYALGSATQAQRFWVSQTGANQATIQLTTNAGDIQGTANLPLGIYFISIQTFNMGPGGYSVFGPRVHGDSHITTTNGIHYDFQGRESLYCSSTSEKYEVQTRMTPVATTGPAPPNPHRGLPTCVSINTAAAVRASKQRITYQPNANGRPDPTGLQLRVDGALVVGRVDGKTLDDMRQSGIENTGELRIAAPRLLDVDMTPPPASAGIAGDVPGDGWLPALADGSSMGRNLPTCKIDTRCLL